MKAAKYGKGEQVANNCHEKCYIGRNFPKLEILFVFWDRHVR